MAPKNEKKGTKNKYTSAELNNLAKVLSETFSLEPQKHYQCQKQKEKNDHL